MRRICILSLLIIQLLILISLAAVQPALPSGINYYIPINIINAQTSAFPSNGQLMVEINSSAYKSYESNNLQNIEFFYQNGTIIPSWLEGDLLNGTLSPNLYNSYNTIYWLRISSGNFLQAESSNVIFLGFASNTVNLFNGNNVGEAPQLSPTYAEYDNGNAIFSFYDNFEGNTLKSWWTGTAVSGHFATVDNGLTLNESSSLYEFFGTGSGYGFSPEKYTAESYSYSTTTTAEQCFNTGYVGNQGGGLVGDAQQYLIASQTSQNAYYLGNWNPNSWSESNTPFHNTSITHYQVFSVWITPQKTYGMVNYGTPLSYNGTFAANNANDSVGLQTGHIAGYTYALWFRVRLLPPNNIMPEAYSGNVEPSSIQTPSPSTQTVDQGQTATLIDPGLSTGSPPYTYQWIATEVNGASGSETSDVANILLGRGVLNGEAQSNNAIWSNTSSSAPGRYGFELVGMDSYPIKVISNEVNIIVDSALSTPSISPRDPIMWIGDSVTLSASWSGGAPDYIARLYSSPVSECNTNSTLIQTVSGLAHGYVAFNPVSPDFTTYYCVFVTDSANVPLTSNSTSAITVYHIQPLPILNLTLSNNVNHSVASNISVLNLYLVSTINGSILSSHSYSQDQLPVSATIKNGEEAKFNFPCAFSTDKVKYEYIGDTYGFGINTQCGLNYTSLIGNYTAIYKLERNVTPAANISRRSFTLALSGNTTYIYIKNWSVTLLLSSDPAGNFNITITNKTSQGGARYPLNFSEISTFSISIFSKTGQETNLSIIPILGYKCDAPLENIMPFILYNNTWTPVANYSVNASSCEVKFRLTGGVVLGLFGTSFNKQKILANPISNNSNTKNASVITKKTPTQILTLNTTKQEGEGNVTPDYRYAIIPVLLAAMVFSIMHLRRRSMRSRP